MRINDSVHIEKGGEIIPKVTKVEISELVLDTGNFIFINSCPACDTELKTIEDQAVHYCPNYKKCPPQVSGRIEHFISKNAMKSELASGSEQKPSVGAVGGPEIFWSDVSGLWGRPGADFGALLLPPRAARVVFLVRLPHEKVSNCLLYTSPSPRDY